MSNRLFFGGFVAILLLSAFLLFQKSEAQNEKTWINTNPQIVVKDDVTNQQKLRPANLDCIDKSFVTLTFANDSTSLADNNKDKCMITNGLGSFSADYVVPGGAGYGYPVMQNNSWGTGVIGVPNQEIFFSTSPGDIYSSRRLYMHESLGDGQFLQIQNNQYRGFVYNVPNNRTALKDTAGRAIDVVNYAFSPNGEWMLLEAPSIGFIKMSTKTREMQLVSSQRFSYGNGFTTGFNMAVSNDGKYVMLAIEQNSVTITDTTNCQGTTAQFSIYSNSDPKCNKKELIQQIKQKFSDYFAMSSMRFNLDNQSIRAVVLQKTGVTKKYSRINLSLDEATSRISYIAMGDSFASGEGDTDSSWYEDGTDVYAPTKNICHLSKRSYPYLIGQAVGNDEFHSVACSAAKVNNIVDSTKDSRGEKGAQYINPFEVNDWLPGLRAQKSYLASPPTYITLSIGGNDLSFGDILSECVLPKQEVACSYAIDPTARGDTTKRTADLFNRLVDTYNTIKSTTSNNTKIYVVGYPQFINPNGETCGKNVQLNRLERAYITESVHYANQVIEAASKKAGVHYLDTENSLNGRNLCSNTPDSQMAVNGLTAGNDKPGISFAILSETTVGLLGNESFHPNQSGHEILKNRILELTNNNPKDFEICPENRTTCEDLSQKIPLPNKTVFGDEAYKYAEHLNDPSKPGVPAPREVKNAITASNLGVAGVGLAVKAYSYLPGTPVNIVMHSAPTQIGTFNASSDGSFNQTIQIPDGAEPGFHTIHLQGKNLNNQPVDYVVKIYVPPRDISALRNEPCGIVPSAGVDYDQDGVDDACDGYIGEPPAPEVPNPEIPAPELPTLQDPKTPLGESVAGLEELVPQAPAPSSPRATSPQQLAVATASTNSRPQSTGGATTLPQAVATTAPQQVLAQNNAVLSNSPAQTPDTPKAQGSQTPTASINKPIFVAGAIVVAIVLIGATQLKRD